MLLFTHGKTKGLYVRVRVPTVPVRFCIMKRLIREKINYIKNTQKRKCQLKYQYTVDECSLINYIDTMCNYPVNVRSFQRFTCHLSFVRNSLSTLHFIKEKSFIEKYFDLFFNNPPAYTCMCLKILLLIIISFIFYTYVAVRYSNKSSIYTLLY